MIKEEVSIGELYKLSVYMQGVWWYADDDDNPFGVAMLVCPDEDKATYLYTLRGAQIQLRDRVKVHSDIWAAPNKKNPMMDKFGWRIWQKDAPINYMLPPRLYNDAVRDLLQQTQEFRESLSEVRKAVTAFDTKIKKSAALKKSRAEWAAWVAERRPGGTHEERPGQRVGEWGGPFRRVHDEAKACPRGVDGSSKGDS